MSCIQASGLQRYGAIITACAYFVIGIPAALVFVFKYDFGIRGIWMGPTIAVCFLTITYMIIFSKIDWLNLIQKAKEQRAKDQQSSDAKVEIDATDEETAPNKVE